MNKAVEFEEEVLVFKEVLVVEVEVEGLRIRLRRSKRR